MRKIQDELTNTFKKDDARFQGKSKGYYYSVLHEARKLAKGICLWGGCNEQADGRYCLEHNEARNLGQRKRWAKRVDKNRASKTL